MIWLDGSRSLPKVVETLARLDTDTDLLATVGGPASQDLKLYHQHEGDSLTVVMGEEQDDVLDELYGEGQDVGYDTEEEDSVWILEQDLQQELDEHDLQQNLASFAAVKKAKQERRVARGFPSLLDNQGPKVKGKGKLTKFNRDFGGKGQGQTSSSGWSTSPSWSKGFKDKWQMGRDRRRQQQGLVKVPVARLATRVRCWKCQQLGHMAAQCPSQSSTPSSRPSYFVHDFQA